MKKRTLFTVRSHLQTICVIRILVDFDGAKNFFEKKRFFSKKGLTIQESFDILYKSQDDLGVAQLVARYLGVVEAASSSLVTQTKIGGSIEPPIFFYFLAISLEISRFCHINNGLVLPCFWG